MTDDFGRKIDYLRLSVTDLCNYRCSYCMPESGVPKKDHSEILSVEELIEIARASVACGIRKIRITGGEPLVRRGILDICRGIGAIEGLEELCMTTNSVFLPEYAAALKSTGVNRINISIDTMNPERFKEITRRGMLTQVLDGIDAAKKAGFDQIKLNIVLLGGINQDEIPSFVSLTRDEAIEVRFIELMPMGECASWDKSRFIKAQTVLDLCPELVRIEDHGVAERYQIPGYMGTVGLISPMSHAFCSKCNRIRVTSDGMLKPCLHSDDEILLRGLKGKELEDEIMKGIARKPGRHNMENGVSETSRCMNRIGG